MIQYMIIKVCTQIVFEGMYGVLGEYRGDALWGVARIVKEGVRRDQWTKTLRTKCLRAQCCHCIGYWW